MNNKDPAFLFYSKDFLSDVIDMTYKERGQYITLLCLMHQRGHMPLKEMKRIVGSLSDVVLNRFQVDDYGLYYIVSLDIEIEKRRVHSEKQREKINARWNNSGNTTVIPESEKNSSFGNTAVLPLANANANANANAIANEKESKDEDTEPSVARKKYGEYNNVLLTDEQFAKLQTEFPADYAERIDKLSGYMRSTGRSYKDHLATIRNWARREASPSTTNPFLKMLAEEEKNGQSGNPQDPIDAKGSFSGVI